MGNESSLVSCGSREHGLHNCVQAEAAGVICQRKKALVVTFFSSKLVLQFPLLQLSHVYQTQDVLLVG